MCVCVCVYTHIVFRTYTILLFIQVSIVSLAIKLVNRKEKNRDSIPDTDKAVFSSLQRPVQLWDLPSFLSKKQRGFVCE